MTTVQEIMRSVSEVLTHAEELNAEGDSEQVGVMLASFLRTLLVDLDKLLVEQPQYTRNQSNKSRPAFDAKAKRPRRNRYDGQCVTCKEHVPEQTGYVLPIRDGKRKWSTYCSGHVPAPATP